LDNLLTIVDRNRLQQGRCTELVNRLEPLTEKWHAFGWSVREVDGHDPEQLFEALTSIPFKSGMPSCIVAHTTKGRGVSFMEGEAVWHHKVPSLGELDLALAELAEG
jgi:transketolase